MDTKEANAAIVQMRELGRCPVKLAEMQAGWNRVVDQLEKFYKSLKPTPKVFEVHHMNEVARTEFACALVSGLPMADCEAIAVGRIIK